MDQVVDQAHLRPECCTNHEGCQRDAVGSASVGAWPSGRVAEHQNPRNAASKPEAATNVNDLLPGNQIRIAMLRIINTNTAAAQGQRDSLNGTSSTPSAALTRIGVSFGGIHARTLARSERETGPLRPA